jgi:hypothetical protein
VDGNLYRTLLIKENIGNHEKPGFPILAIGCKNIFKKKVLNHGDAIL